MATTYGKSYRFKIVTIAPDGSRRDTGAFKTLPEAEDYVRLREADAPHGLTPGYTLSIEPIS